MTHHLAFEVDDLDAACARLAENGVALEGGPMPRGDGYVQVFFLDPDGHVLELFQQTGEDQRDAPARAPCAVRSRGCSTSSASRRSGSAVVIPTDRKPSTGQAKVRVRVRPPLRASRSSRQIRGARGAVVASYAKDGLHGDKRQQTMAKITRERAVKEKRERKLEKKRAAAAERKALARAGRSGRRR